MDLNQIDIKLAARTNSQAINLGFVTARRYQSTLLLSATLAVLPVFIFALLISWLFDWHGLASFLLWWCKPYYDRVVLLNASRLVFRDKVSFAEVVESLGRATKNGLWRNLTLYRLSPSRCLTLPIMLLEGLTGKDYGQRVKVVSKGASSSATAMTLGLVHVEAILYLNAGFFILMIVPDSLVEDWAQWLFLQRFRGVDVDYAWLMMVMLCFQAMATIIVSIFYVMTGFMLYLNSRIKMEGWDIELAFKRMAERLSGQRQPKSSILNEQSKPNTHRQLMSWFFAAALSTVSLGMVLPESAQANEPAQSITGESDANGQIIKAPAAKASLEVAEDKKMLKDLLLSDDLNPYETESKWEKKNQKKLNPKDFDMDWDFNKYSQWFKGLAGVIKILLIVLGLWFVYWLVVNRHQLATLFQGKAKVDENLGPTVMFGLDITKASLPNNIAVSAKKLLDSGDMTGALSLLYRGSLASLVTDYAVVIDESDTEGDCLRAAEQPLPEGSYQYFKQLTAAWQQLVYAHQSPDLSEVGELISQWDTAFFAHHVAINAVVTEEAM